ncbi:protein SODIUM POTASSIUM ROOT DEFECTIVE 3-like [Neltuma alba]|uniref:protein SODIUM POTASSIUM ROOT DEFECTIVE 3-like n=1 Tax=Neltuma alba TaxID=207710 RepID=UPI0010A442EB|nr:protein SODIUM POTASSIUM ROOT DEFECTIVE 3-like [Prosopis alba]
MKGMDLFCSSPASTAVISSMHVQRSTVRRSRKSYGLLAPVPCSCSSLSPINPRPSHEKHGKSSEDKQNHDRIRRKSHVQLNDLYTHCSSASSTTHLLADSDSSFIHTGHSPALRSSSSPRSRNQVVVLRVSLHCKGCAAKVGKHVSKMQGVTSFSIDMEAKKVTIVGNVTPLGVLASVSKVKNAQLWPSSASSSMAVAGV